MIPRQKIPERIGRLGELAQNLWWSWNNPARDLFRALDYPLWRLTGHNPVKMLRDMKTEQFTAAAGDAVLMVMILTFSLMTVLMINLLRIGKRGMDMTPVSGVILGILYIPLLMSHFMMVRQTPAGAIWIFFILILAFSGDIAAYYVGRALGTKKLLPQVSPGKTVEGTIGLIAGSIAGCLVFRQLFLPSLPVIHAVLLGLMGSIVGQLGDLCESALKRSAGVKDSGTLLPGHGGILDRLDCLMFIAPFVYYYRVLIVR